MLSAQVTDIYANGAKNENYALVNELETARFCCNRSDRGILPRVGRAITASSSNAMFADGTISPDIEATLTVLNSDEGLARISIGTSLYGTHEFLVGRVGDNYYGTSVDLEGTIVLERMGRYLEVTFTRIVNATNLPIQVHARFRL
ncbi:MAG: hypothetical protein H0V82_10095 [Candidatus Protochlamydia sp.]|nr:hypothetical protein [Candidatus Protochlamydia sp.]